MMTMTFYVTRTDDGLIHVQNTVMGMFGQHHVHDEAGFAQWRKGAPDKGIGPVADDSLEEIPAPKCDCGLTAGEMRNCR